MMKTILATDDHRGNGNDKNTVAKTRNNTDNNNSNVLETLKMSMVKKYIDHDDIDHDDDDNDDDDASNE